MTILIKNTEGLQLPSQANPGEDGGYDVIATSGPNIVGYGIANGDTKLWSRISYIEYGTGLFLAPIPEKDIELIRETRDHIINFNDCSPIEIDKIFHIEGFPRSSVSKYNLVLANCVGTIDTGYRNEIMCRFKYIFQPEDLCVIDGKIF